MGFAVSGDRRGRALRSSALALGALGLLASPALVPPRPAAAAPAAVAAATGEPGLAAAAAWRERVRTAPATPALPPPAGPVSAARKFFTDVELVDQDGRTHRFYSDLLQGKVVVVAAFFTSCTGSCPVLGERLAAVQQWLGERLGKDVYLLSLSADPKTDTPARLKQYAKRLGARSGWFFLTGKKENVDWALYKLGSYAEGKEAHSNLLVLGNEPAGLWKKVFGLAPPQDLIHSLDAVLRNRG
jgi:protein SCO1/2